MASAPLAMGQRLDLTPPPTLGPGSSPELAKLATGLRVEADALRGETATPQDELSASIRVLAAALLERADALGPPGSLHGIVGLGLEANRGELDAELTAHPRLDDLHRLVLARRLRALATDVPDEPDALARALRDTLAPSLELMGAEATGRREPPIAPRIETWREAGLIDDALAGSLREFDQTLSNAARWAAYAPWVDRTRRVVSSQMRIISDARDRVPDASEALTAGTGDAVARLCMPSISDALAGVDSLVRVGDWSRALVAVEGDVYALAALTAMLTDEAADPQDVSARLALVLRLAEARDAPLPGAADVPRLLRPAHIEFVAEFRRLASLLDREIGLALQPGYQGESSANGITAALNRERETIEQLHRAGRRMTKPSDRESVTDTYEPIARQVLQATRRVQRAKTRGERVMALEALRLIINAALPDVANSRVGIWIDVAMGRRESPVLTRDQAQAMLAMLTNGPPGDVEDNVLVMQTLSSLVQDTHETHAYRTLALDARVRLVRQRIDCAISWGMTAVDETIATPTPQALRAVLDPTGPAKAHRLTLAGIASLAARDAVAEAPSREPGVVTLVDSATLVVPMHPRDLEDWLGEIAFLRYAAEACVADVVSPGLVRHLEAVTPAE